MVTTTRKYTIDDLWQLPPDAPFELWRGELIEMPPSGLESSIVAHWIGVRFSLFVEPRDLGLVSGEGGGYILFSGEGRDTVVAPDIGFVRWERLPERRRPRGHCPVPPDLALEVTSPFDEPGKIRAKVRLYMDAGVPLVWWVDLQRQVVRVYRPGKGEEVLGAGGILDGEEVLPGFRLAVADIFAL